MMKKLQGRFWPLVAAVAGLALSPVLILAEDPSTSTPTVAQEDAGKKVVTTSEEGAHPKQVGLIVKEIEVRFIGSKTANESVVLANMKTQVGEPFTQTQSDDDVRSLYATKQFSNVQILQERVADGVKIIVIVQGKAKLKDILFAGNTRYKDKRLKKEIKLKVGDVLSERQVADGARALVEFYQKAGYPYAKANFDVTPDELTGQSVVKYTITEGAQFEIARVDFVGNKAFTTKILRKKIETRKWSWLTSWITKKGHLQETAVDEDKQKIAEFYRSEGYIDADVKDVKYDFPATDKMVVTFFVFEGNQYKVGKIGIEGNKLFSTAELEQKLKMKAGDLFTPGGLQGNIKGIQDLYGARGYIDAVVKPTRVPNITTGTMDVALNIREGELVHIDLIEIRGNIKTKDKVIRRELAVAPGDVYDSVKVDASKQRLENLGYFSRVTAQPEEASAPNRKNLAILVEEQRTGSISFGAGFSSVDSILGFVEVTQGNFDIAKPPYFTGAGQKARVRAQFGARRQDYIISFTEPWFMNRRLAVGFDLFYNEANYISAVYNERRYGFDLRAGKALGEFNKIDVMYKFEQIELFNMASGVSQLILDERGSRTKSSLGATLGRDTRDNLTLTTKGYKAELWSEVAGGPALAGQTDIYKFGFTGQIYFLMPWWEKNVLSFNGSTAVVEQWDDGTRVPIFEKFFLGGPSSVRGFKFRDIGPKDTSFGEPVGGKTMAYLQTEYSVPVIDRVRFASFVDMGQAWSRAYDWGNSPVIGAGVGIRLNLPIGPINLDYGWPIRRDQNTTTSNGQFSFNVGTRF